MKKALIIGAAGFVGSYLIDHIQKNCIWSIAVTKMPHEIIDCSDIDIYDLDIMEKESVEELIKKLHPDYIFHLAAQSSVALSWEKPDLTVDVNIKGSLHILEVARKLDYKPRILLLGSGEEYGYIRSEEVPVTEKNTVRPGNIYAATKACQNMLGKIYAAAYGLDVINVRAFNHIGPNQTPIFVVADFCKQVAEIEAGKREAVIKVGNLATKRDFTDVRDVVCAYVMLIQQGKAGETYNIGSGHAIEIGEILKRIIELSNIEIHVEVDEKKLRPVDIPVIEADIKKIQECCGWNPKISLKMTLEETLNYWRMQIQKEERVL